MLLALSIVPSASPQPVVAAATTLGLFPAAVTTRRAAILSAAATVAAAFPVHADDEVPPRVLTDAEMEARVARKMELLRASSGGPKGSAGAGAANGGLASVLDSSARSDYNPDAAVNLRSRSAIENAKLAMSKNEEMKKRDKKQKRDDLCEMLGRGC